MPTLDEQIEAMKQECEATLELWVKGYAEHKELAMFRRVVESLELLKSNGSPLQSNRKKCSGCGEMFTPKNQTQEVCSGKCRVRTHRNNNRLKEFNAKVGEILRAKDAEAKFTVEQCLVENGKCPFVVTYKGTTYKADNTRSLLTQLKKI
ncbi:MAG: hypothetical protein JKY55_12540 [Aliivibrio sp.]|uniref:hypothetical protein n=1 Tax=Aliivibrio sp. TaxID=1872443 RepID=UPI001A577209|nr:hypothetical protein [Aliivibrio sp.]